MKHLFRFFKTRWMTGLKEEEEEEDVIEDVIDLLQM